jgi:hypothetical protein
MCHVPFTEITYLQFCCLKIIAATETETKTQKIAQNKKLSPFDKADPSGRAV